VGVVDQDREVLALGDRLETAGNPSGGGQPGSGRLRIDPKRERGGEGAERVGDVEMPRQRRLDLN